MHLNNTLNSIQNSKLLFLSPRPRQAVLESARRVAGAQAVQGQGLAPAHRFLEQPGELLETAQLSLDGAPQRVFPLEGAQLSAVLAATLFRQASHLPCLQQLPASSFPFCQQLLAFSFSLPVQPSTLLPVQPVRGPTLRTSQRRRGGPPRTYQRGPC